MHTEANDTPSLRDALPVIHKALRAYAEQLKGREALDADVAMTDVDERLQSIEPEIGRLARQTTAPPDGKSAQIREEMSRISRELKRLDEETA